MTHPRLVPILLLLPLSFTSLACPTRTIAFDGGTDAPSETDGNAETTGAAGEIGGLGGVGGGLGGAPSDLAGASGQSIGGSSGVHGGAGGTTICTNTTTDALNCGSCGHSCLGGQCSAGACEPLLLGTVPNTTEYAHETVVSGGKVYVFTGVGQNQASSVWQTDSSTPETPTEISTNGTVSCVMNGQLFWMTDNQGSNGIASCTLSNCAATTTPIVTLMSGQFFGMPPGCDEASNEIVWTSSPDNAEFRISRASPDGSNARTITSFDLVDNSWHLVGNGSFPGKTDRIFYRHFDFTSGTDWLYYISTNVVNATGVQIAEVQNLALGPGIASPLELANDAVFLADEFNAATSAYSILSIPLPNGILSGTPPAFANGYIYEGVLDQTTFYGVIEGNSAIPDAVIKCPLANCSAPTIIAPGQRGANFADDDTAIYWTTFGQASNVAIWKAAK